MNVLKKEERKKVNEQFWTLLRNHMKSHRSSNGKRINWLNYPSDISHIFVRMETDSNSVRLCYDVQFKDPSIRSIVWEQLNELKNVLENRMNHPTIWSEAINTKDGRTIDRISWELNGVNYLLPEHESKIICFFQDRLLEFDSFYQEFKDVLILLVK